MGCAHTKIPMASDTSSTSSASGESPLPVTGKSPLHVSFSPRPHGSPPRATLVGVVESMTPETAPRATLVVDSMPPEKHRDLTSLDEKIGVYERKLRVHPEGSYKHTKYLRKLQLLEYKFGLQALNTRESVIKPKLRKLVRKHRKELRKLKKQSVGYSGDKLALLFFPEVSCDSSL